MNGNLKKPQIALLLLAGVGLFLPLYKFSAYGESESISFIKLFDITSEKAGMTIINSKIVLGVLIVAFISLLIRFGKDELWIKIVSLCLIVLGGVLYYVDIDKLSAAKVYLSSMMKYSFGFYMTVIGFVIAFILGLVDIVNSHSTYKSMDDYTFDVLKKNNSNNVNATYNMLNNNQGINNSVPNNVVPQEQNVPPTDTTSLQNQIKLNDLVNHNQSSENQSNTNNINQ